MLRSSSILASILAVTTFACASSSDDQSNTPAASESAIRDDQGVTPAPERSPVVIVHIAGAFENYFTSPDSYRNTTAFGVSPSNVIQVQAPDVTRWYAVDSSLGPFADLHRDHFATVGIRYGLHPSAPANTAFIVGDRNFATEFAPEVVQIGEPSIPGIPSEAATAGLGSDLAHAQELARTGKDLVIVNTRQVTSAPDHFHARWEMTELVRTIGYLQSNVTYVIVGDFAHYTNGEDILPNMNALVIGPHVRTGTMGRVAGNGELPPNTPGDIQFWAYLADVAKAPATFGTDYNASLVESAPAP